MTLAELFSYLTYGELSNIKCGGKKEGGIEAGGYTDEVVSYITQGLTELHTRFDLKKNELIVILMEEVGRYKLTSAHALSNTESTEYYKYIDDEGMYPYEDDLIRIDRVYNELGIELTKNIVNPNVCTILIPQYNVIQVVNPQDENALAVDYKANHRPIKKQLDSGLTSNQIEIEIPASLVQPLCMYVGYLAHNAVGTPESVGKGLGKLQQYEVSCLSIERNGILNQENFDTLKFFQDGWV